MSALFPYRWYLKNGYPDQDIPFHGKKVFGTFICGGGSSMGYKRAGYNHLGGVEIDPKISRVYEVNHHPKYLYREDLRLFINRTDLPDELYDLDILDGSPPCSSFSMAGNREEDWGKEKVFREGQAMQRLDDLFFDFIDLAAKLKPKVVLAENVKGLIAGNARAYVKEIVLAFKKAGYVVQLFMLNAASMGVPQKRERVFFVCRRADLPWENISLKFDLKPITFGEVEDQVENPIGKGITQSLKPFWEAVRPGNPLSKEHPLGHYFTTYKLSRSKVVNTIGANEGSRFLHYRYPNKVSDECIQLCGSFPLDYDFMGIDPQYIIGMSVPPVMMARISDQVYRQWLSK